MDINPTAANPLTLKVNPEPNSQYYLSVGGAHRNISNEFITTAFDIPGYQIIKNCGIAKGITVRSRNICFTISAILCSLGGGRNPLFTELCEQARDEAQQLLILQAQHIGGNAIIGFRFESHDIADGITEVLAYGTAVVVSPK